ncbi:6394_t:CDS:2, partial [Ambispora leptoticha]
EEKETKSIIVLIKAGNKSIRRYLQDDLEKLTKSKRGNHYHFDEEWKTDEDQSMVGEKVKKLVCIDKWWRGSNIKLGTGNQYEAGA